jgi:hypothetical protein
MPVKQNITPNNCYSKKDFKSSNLFIYIIVAEVERFTFNRGFIISLQAYRA